MLVMCPECKKRFSETAESCPKCGFVLDETIRRDIKIKTIRNNRLGLTVLAVLMLLFSGPCIIAPCMEHRGHTTVIRTREEAIGRLEEERLRAENGNSDGEVFVPELDVEAITHGDVTSRVSPEEEKEASWSCFWISCLALVLPAVGILVYLYLTKQEPPNED